jgi:hypothetical protein
VDEVRELGRRRLEGEYPPSSDELTELQEVQDLHYFINYVNQFTQVTDDDVEFLAMFVPREIPVYSSVGSMA